MKNRILSDKDRKLYSDLLEDMGRVIPEIMKLKFPRSEVQAAFILDSILKLGTDNKNILCVGYDEDPVYFYLTKKRIKVTAIDPRFNYDLHTFLSQTTEKFDIIFSTSVMEHVEDDEQFIKDICTLLNVGGTAILTVDFLENQPVISITDQFLTSNGIKNGIRMGREQRMELRRLQDEQKNKATSFNKPSSDFRLYTTNDYKRLSKVLTEYNCFFVDEIYADIEPDFELGNCKYNFATMVFKKLR